MHEEWQKNMMLNKREKKLATKTKFEKLDEAGKQKHKAEIPGFIRREFTERCREHKITPKQFANDIKAEFDDAEYYF